MRRLPIAISWFETVTWLLAFHKDSFLLKADYFSQKFTPPLVIITEFIVFGNELTYRFAQPYHLSNRL
jgi:hypothetical protein